MKQILTTLALVLALTLWLACAPAEDAGFLGQPFPDFTATDTEGNVFTLSGALKDHDAVLINIWATWCPHCETEMPLLNEACEQLGGRVAFIVLSCEEGDTLEVIAEYRRTHGLTLPMGRDEGGALFGYLGQGALPATVIVDRFGNAVFQHTGSFFTTGEILRTAERFLGDGYTESVTLAEIPADTATGALPVFPASEIRVENEGARLALFWLKDDPVPQPVWVVSGPKALLRLETAAADNPASLVCFDVGRNVYLELPSLLDPVRGVCLYEADMPEAGADPFYACVALGNTRTGLVVCSAYLVSDEADLDRLRDVFASQGYETTWEYARETPGEAPAPGAYVLQVVDQDGAPVPGVMAKFCTDVNCVLLQSDGDGRITFTGEPAVYEVQLLKVPAGYGFDPAFVLTTRAEYGEWLLRIRKD